ncbi:hypothetical protein, partial [Helicobacter pylori]|uniref:hypothetical protein n=1 Tax=Helicobacter pylori TaxID=210 RepID=UPI001C6342CB
MHENIPHPVDQILILPASMIAVFTTLPATADRLACSVDRGRILTTHFHSLIPLHFISTLT